MKKLLLLLSIFLVSQLAKAQWNFTVTLSASGCGNSMEEKIAWKEAEAQVNYWMGKGHLTFHSKMECEQSRQFVMSESYSVGNCKLRYIASPCTGSGGTSENVDAFGISKGNSFYSTNGANEIRDWSNDDMERMIALDKDYKPLEPTNVTTGDANYDNARKEIDLSKPFRSLNIDEDAQINTPSADLSNIDVEWQFIKASKKIPYESIEEYKDHQLEEALSLICKLQNLFNMSIDELVSNLSVIDMNLRIALQGCEDDYKNQREMLEKILQLAEYKVEYKNIMMMEYMDKHPQNPDPHGADWEKLGTWLAKVVPTPWMKEYQEKYGNWDKKYLEGREKELIETYGISKTDIEAMKQNMDNDTFIADIASATSSLLGGAKKANQLMWIYDKKSQGFIADVLGNAKDVLPMVVVATDWIKARDYESQRNLVKEEKENLDKGYAETKNNIKKQIDMTNALNNLVDIVTHYNSGNSKDMSKKEQLNLANRIGKILENFREVNEAGNSTKRLERTYIEYQGN